MTCCRGMIGNANIYPFQDMNICISIYTYIFPQINLACKGLTFHNRESFQYHGLISIPSWISNHMPSKVWDEITYPFPIFNGATIEGWEWISNFISHFFNGFNYLSMSGFKLNYVSKRSAWILFQNGSIMFSLLLVRTSCHKNRNCVACGRKRPSHTHLKSLYNPTQNCQVTLDFSGSPLSIRLQEISRVTWTGIIYNPHVWNNGHYDLILLLIQVTKIAFVGYASVFHLTKTHHVLVSMGCR